MTEEQRIYAKIFFDNVSTERILRETQSPLRIYEHEFVEGPIIDIGCGQSEYLLDFAKSGRKLFGIDSDPQQLEYLEIRLKEISNGKNWELLNIDFPKAAVPPNIYSVIVYSNILHFFTIEECREIGKITESLTTKGSLILVCVHSENHLLNSPSNPNRNDDFKHYFTTTDLKEVFPSRYFEAVYQGETKIITNSLQNHVRDLYVDECFMLRGVSDKVKIENTKKQITLDNSVQNQITMIFRRL